MYLEVFKITFLGKGGTILLRATSHMRLRARDQYTSSIFVGVKMRSRSKFSSHYV